MNQDISQNSQINQNHINQNHINQNHINQKEKTEIIKARTYKKSNELINAKGKGTLLSQKLFAVGMQNLRIDETNNVVATIYGTELRKLFGSNSGSLYTHIEELCDREKKGSTIFDWNILLKDPENKHLVARQVVTDAEFKDGVLTLRYNNSLTDKIINLCNNFTTLSLSETMCMKSVYSLRLLEILKAAYDRDTYIEQTKRVREYTYSIIEIKFALGIVGTGGDKRIRDELSKEHPDYAYVEELAIKNGENKYSEYKDFNKNVLCRATQEISEKTDLKVTYEPVKSNRKAVAVRFFVYREKKGSKKEADSRSKNINGAEMPEDIDEFMDRCMDMSMDILGKRLPIKDVRAILTEAGWDLDVVERAFRAAGASRNKIENLTGFVLTAIKEGYSVVTGVNDEAPDEGDDSGLISGTGKETRGNARDKTNSKIRTKGNTGGASGRNNSFNRFSQGDYDVDELEELFVVN